MSTYQQNQISHLQNIGWSQNGSSFLPGVGQAKGATLFRLTNESGHRAYIYPTWTQYIV